MTAAAELYDYLVSNDVIVTTGHRYTLILISLTKMCVQSEMPVSMRLRFLEQLNKMTDDYITDEVVAAIEPMCNEAYEIVREAQKLGPKALDQYADMKVFSAFVAKNPSLLTAIKLAETRARER